MLQSWFVLLSSVSASILLLCISEYLPTSDVKSCTCGPAMAQNELYPPIKQKYFVWENDDFLIFLVFSNLHTLFVTCFPSSLKQE